MKKNNKNNNHKILNKNYIKGAISGALALTILCSGVGVAAYSAGADNTAQALGVQTESTVEAVKKASTTKEALKKLSKNETVYVIADASGAAKKIIVSDWLKGVDTKGKVKDVSNLKDVKNVKGDETYTVNEDNAYEWAANGDDIYYQGTGTTELPVKLKLSYKLNGKTVSADEIAGKSGKVTIRIDYENTQKEKVKINGKTEEVNVPFLMLSGMILDDDKFKNVEVSNGKAINDGTRTIVAGFALPGMQDSLDIDKDEMEIPDYVEITADTTDFELSTTMTVAMNDIFNDVDFSKVDDKVDELKDSLDELEDAAEQLVDGSSQLYDGIGTLLDKSGTLIEGIDKLYDGAEQVNSGAKKLDSGAGDLSNGAKTLDDGAAKLDSGLATLAGGASQVDNGAASLSSYVATLAGGLGKLSSNSATLNGGAEQVFNTLLSTADTLIATSGLTADKLTIKNYDSVLEGLISSLSDENSQKLAYNTALETVTATVNSQKDVIKTAVEATVRKSVTEQVLAAAGLGMTADQYDAAVAAGQVSEEVQAQVSTAVSTQMSSSAVQALIDSNTVAQIQSLIETNMNSEEVKSQIQAGIAKAQAGRKLLQALKTQLDSYNTFYQGLLSYTAGVDQANEGAQQILAGTYTLKDGTSSLVNGTGQLKNGSSSLKSGTSELKSGTSSLSDGTTTLLDGIATLKNGGKTLVDGVQKLNDGAMTLSKGMKKFKEEGIDSIVDAANGDVKDIIDRFKAVQKASKKYNNYSGISDDMDGKVDFIYKTDSIEKK